MEHNEELRLAWEFVEHTDKSIFLTGKAGTGKTTFLKTLLERSTKRMVVVAPTGVAAINAGGVTIHSFFQLPLSPFVPNARFKERYNFGKDKRRIIGSIDVLVIDEISMVRSDLLDAIDSVLRRYRDNSKPFGGVQLLMIGDLQQLTPVVTAEDELLLKPYYDTPYFFGSHALQQIEYVTIELKKVYRQQDDHFVDILNHIREGNPTQLDMDILNSRCNPAFIPDSDDGYIRLTTHNNLADSYNKSELSKLTSLSRVFNAEISGTFPEYAYPTSTSLELRVGAQVMFVKNDPSGSHRYYNGRIGKVIGMGNDFVTVRCAGGDEDIVVEPQEWENAKYTLNDETKEIETDIQGVFRQLPLRLAWAITIHKSQGLTFEHAIIDTDASFASGQVYVALSRCKTLEGLVLASPVNPRSIINDERVTAYISRQEVATAESVCRLPLLKEEYYRSLLLELFSFTNIIRREDYVCRQFIEFFSNSFHTLTVMHKSVSAKLRNDIGTVAFKWASQIAGMPQEQLHGQEFLERVVRSCNYFVESLTAIMDTAVKKTKEVKTGNKEAMRRLDNAYTDLVHAYISKKYLLNYIAEHGFTMSSYLKYKQLAVLAAMEGASPDAIAKKDRVRKSKAAKEVKKEKKEKTKDITMRMLRSGMNPEEIARERSLAYSTIMGHLEQFIETGELSVNDVMSGEKYQTIIKVIDRLGSNSGLTAIKELCPPDVNYYDIRIVLSSINNI